MYVCKHAWVQSGWKTSTHAYKQTLFEKQVVSGRSLSWRHAGKFLCPVLPGSYALIENCPCNSYSQLSFNPLDDDTLDACSCMTIAIFNFLSHGEWFTLLASLRHWSRSNRLFLIFSHSSWMTHMLPSPPVSINAVGIIITKAWWFGFPETVRCCFSKVRFSSVCWLSGLSLLFIAMLKKIRCKLDEWIRRFRFLPRQITV